MLAERKCSHGSYARDPEKKELEAGLYKQDMLRYYNYSKVHGSMQCTKKRNRADRMGYPEACMIRKNNIRQQRKIHNSPLKKSHHPQTREA